MIRGRDQLRLSLQKLRLRKRRAVFAIGSVALGAVVVVTVSSLVDGVRAAAIKTMWTEELDPGVVRVYARDNPYEYNQPGDEKPQKTKKRFQYLTEAILDDVRAWPEVEAAEKPVVVGSVSISAFEDRPQPVTYVQGVPEALVRRYAKEPGTLAACTNAIPLVVGERLARLCYNAKTGKFEPAGDAAVQAWIGREVEIVVGDNYASVTRFIYDSDKRTYKQRDEAEITAGRELLVRNYKSMNDMGIYNATLRLKGRVVGLREGHEVWMPGEPARSCDRWLTERNRLAALQPSPAADAETYDVRGRRTPRTGEFAEAVVLVKREADTEAVAKKITDLGFTVATRARAFESQVKSFDSGFRVVKIIAYAFGGIILGMAGALIWSTTSKVVSDSRVDIGLFRALGATKRDIRRLFLTDSVLLGLMGTTVGMCWGWLLAYSISVWVLRFVRSQIDDPIELLLMPDTIFAFNAEFCALLLVATAVVALLAGLWPASRAANVDPVKALKRE